MREQVRGEVAQRESRPGAASEQPICDRHHGVEVRARHGAQHEDQDRQAERGGQAVLQQLEADVIRREALRSDAGTHNDRDEQARSKELGSSSAQHVRSRGLGLGAGSNVHVGLS